MSVDGDTALTARICCGWFKLGHWHLLIAIDVSLLLQGKVYDACVLCMELTQWRDAYPNVVILRFNGHFPGEPGLAGVY